MTPDQMNALTEQARRVKRALDGEPLENIYGESYQDYMIAKADEDMIDFARQCAAILTGPARLEWVKMVRDGIALYELGGLQQSAFTFRAEEECNEAEMIAKRIEKALTDLAAILTAGLEGK